jgi:hypothetical protein
LPSPLTETHVIEGEPDAFHDAALVAEVVRIYNYKRAFCGQTRIDLGTPTTKVFKEATNYADGPVTGDVDTEVSCRDTGSFRDYLLLLWIFIPQTYVARKTVGLDKYFWCTPGTDDPLPLPDGWEGLVVTAETLKNPALWGTVLPLIIEAVNALQEMAVTIKPVAQMRDFSYTGRYVTHSLESGPEMFQVVNNGPATRGTRRRPIYSTRAIEDESVSNPYGRVYFPRDLQLGGVRPARWSFSIPGFDSSEYFCIEAGPDTGGSRDEFRIADHGDITKVLLGVTKCEFTTRVTVQTSGTYTITYGVLNEWPNYKGKTAVATFDGTATAFPLLTTGLKTATTTRYITAPYQDFDCSVSVDFGLADFWETDVRSSDGGPRTPVFAFDSSMVWQPGFNTLPNQLYVGTYPGPTTYAAYPFSVGFGFEVDATIDGEWDGWSYDTSGNRFWVDTSRYSISYQRTIYNVGGAQCCPAIGVS